MLLARAIFLDLCEMSDSEAAKFSEYEMLEMNLELGDTRNGHISKGRQRQPSESGDTGKTCVQARVVHV